MQLTFDSSKLDGFVEYFESLNVRIVKKFETPRAQFKNYNYRGSLKNTIIIRCYWGKSGCEYT